MFPGRLKTANPQLLPVEVLKGGGPALLRQLAHAVEDEVAAEIVRCLGSSCSREELKSVSQPIRPGVGCVGFDCFRRLALYCL